MAQGKKIYLECKGSKYSVEDIAKKIGLTRSGVLKRIADHPNDPCKVVNTPFGGGGKRKPVPKTHPWKSGPRGYSR